MIREQEIQGGIILPSKNLKRKRWISKFEVITTVLKELLQLKSTAKHGYFLSVTNVKVEGEAIVKDNSDQIELPVTIFCRTLLPKTGDITTGVVHKVCRMGVLLRCGNPLNHVYLSAQKMVDYRYVRLKSSEIFMKKDCSRIAKGVVVRFVVFAVRWNAEHQVGKRELFVLASIEGDGLGPVSMAGSDSLDL
ncbi:DNA-directed RNA polymerase V subunit 7-like [Impatiens glandulifera]|uniref:DNA-directed RNA polymerase V subunit 7-like n=1 Tax=Impatiens glandulifera TaxID=253017 RepID=UPI001FB053E0|nr:DNA-directed RNA polymerase V subunit 7-like [Impatiens glandulifera]